MKKFKILSIAFFALLLALSPVNQSHASNAGAWVGAGFCSLIYTPVKTAFAILMGVTGGLSLIATVPAGDTSASAQIVKWGMFGDWLIRPDHLSGQSDIKFVGTGNRARFVRVDSNPQIAQRE
ncbi:MAG: hypothetical protein L0Y39_04160 [Methylococcaceae bacterium]|nr:hypothetical protein [Methylococcaceae bacterium]